MIYYVSDMHFGRDHPLLLRGYETIELMTQALIEKWNKKVRDEDIVYIVGDIADNSHADISQYIKALNGKKRLIIGNQDRTWYAKMTEESKKELFESISFYEEIEDNGSRVVLCHYPMMEWLSSKKGTVMVHGHTHSSKEMMYWEYLKKQKNILNAGVDVNNLEPCTLEELYFNNDLFKGLAND